MTLRQLLLLPLLCFAFCAHAQTPADRILGSYKAPLSNNDAYVRVFRYDDGYRMQVYALRDTHNPDGTLKTDAKNPDKSKRNTPLTQVVLIDKVTYHDGIWKGGRIYDPTHGKTYKVELRLQPDNNLEVRGIVGPFHKSFYWTKVK